ncbi:MAG: hypothetical protein JXQ90_15105 [Cyclobacteriaceae bacterium]
MGLIIGIDGGGTNTRSLLTNEEGDILGSAIGGAANFRSEGVEMVKTHLKELLEATCKNAGTPLSEVDVVSLGLAGVATDEGKRTIKNIVVDLGFDADKVIVNSDADIALIGAHGKEEGIIAIAGTGAVVFGQKGDRKVRSSGWGHILGDEGSAYWIGIECMKAVIAAHDLHIKETKLTAALVGHLRLEKISELIDFTYSQTTKSEIAALAQLVMQHYSDDEAARSIINNGARHLFDHINHVHGLLGDDLSVCLMGGMLENETPLKHSLTQLLDQKEIRHLSEPTYRPEYGAVIVGLRKLSIA